MKLSVLSLKSLSMIPPLIHHYIKIYSSAMVSPIDTILRSSEYKEMADQDEAAVLRHHIAQLDDKLCQIRAASTPAAAAVHDGNELSSDLAAHLYDQGDTSVLSRVLQEFCKCIKYLQKPSLLKSASDYSI
ncbi:predicted protein [Histoplasma capsulatum var. duboisii H88]|uniref:Predicted protein n=1 Tax=Ajellomyces capsulatus (strain H88) TaxID=544711 RepID=F0UGY8_AJEC8|nr:predicted protein [Histoplasma capsulatum var. duboisii H88]